VYGNKELPWRSVESAGELLVASFLLKQTMIKQDAGVYMAFIHGYPSMRHF
jgi:adenine-specific DNA glycosylase